MFTYLLTYSRSETIQWYRMRADHSCCSGYILQQDQCLPEVFVRVRFQSVLFCTGGFRQYVVCSEACRYLVNLFAGLESKHRLHTTDSQFQLDLCRRHTALHYPFCILFFNFYILQKKVCNDGRLTTYTIYVTELNERVLAQHTKN